jgi:hypothetical protein
MRAPLRVLQLAALSLFLAASAAKGVGQNRAQDAQQHTSPPNQGDRTFGDANERMSVSGPVHQAPVAQPVEINFTSRVLTFGRFW